MSEDGAAAAPKSEGAVSPPAAGNPFLPPAELLYAGHWRLVPPSGTGTVTFPVHVDIAAVSVTAANQPVDWASFTDASGQVVWCQRIFKLECGFDFDRPLPAPPVVVLSIIDGNTNSSAILTGCTNTSFSFRILGDANLVSVAIFGPPRRLT